MKVCSGCDSLKPLEGYYKSKNTADGYMGSCKECHKARMQRHRSTEEQYLMRREYIQKNREYYRELGRKQMENRRKAPGYSIVEKMRMRVNRALSPDCKQLNRKIDAIGCTPAYLRYYLESKFKEGMTWENRGYTGWHIDFIVPVTAFDLADPEQVKLCFHFKNMQPLWYIENILKSNKLPDQFRDAEEAKQTLEKQILLLAA